MKKLTWKITILAQDQCGFQSQNWIPEPWPLHCYWRMLQFSGLHHWSGPQGKMTLHLSDVSAGREIGATSYMAGSNDGPMIESLPHHASMTHWRMQTLEILTRNHCLVHRTFFAYLIWLNRWLHFPCLCEGFPLLHTAVKDKDTRDSLLENECPTI